MVLIDDDNSDSRRSRATRAENPGEDRKEDDRHDEAEDHRCAIATQIHPAGAHNRSDHSRNSLPVRCRKTLSRVGTFSIITTSRFSPTVARTSSSFVPLAMIFP